MSATGLPRASAVPQHVGCYSPSNLPKPKRRLLVGKSNRLDHAFTETALLEEVFVDKANLNVMQRQMRTEYKSANAVHDVLGSTRRANAALLDGGGHAGKRQNPRMSVIRPPPSPPPPPPRHFTGDRDEGVSLKSALETGTHPAVASLLRENRVGKGHTQRAEDFFLQTVDAVYSPPPANPSTAIKAPFVLTNLPATTNFGGGAMEHNDPQSYLYSRNEVVTRADIRDIREHEKMEYERTRDDVPKPPPYLFEPPVPKDGQVYIRAPWAAAGELAPIQRFSDEAEASKVGVRPNNVFLTPAELAEEDRRTIDRRRRVVEVREQRRQAQMEQAARVRRPPMPPRDLPSMNGSTVPSSKSSVAHEEEYLRELPAAEVEAVDCSARSSVRGSTASASPAQRPTTEVNVLNLEQQQQQQQDANNVPISPAQSRSRTSSHRTTPAASLHATSPAMSVRSASTATASVREQATPAASLHATSPAMSVRSASTATASVREQATPAASLHATSPAMSVRSASTATASIREQATPAASIPPTPASTTPSSRRSGSQHETQHHRCAVPLSAAAAERARHPRRPNGEAAIPASPDDAWIESYTPTARPYDVGPFLGRCGYKDCRLTYHWVQPEANSAMHSRPAEYRSVSHVQLDTPNDWQRTHGGVRRYPHVPK